MKDINQISTNQLWPGRDVVLKQIVKQFTKPVIALEVGTWFGLGSTKMFIEHLPKGSTLFLVDPWSPYGSDEDKKLAADINQMDLWHEEAYESAKSQAILAEGISVELMRGKSSHVLAQMPEKLFDLIYIDGSHYYDDVKKDIIEAKRLIKRGGIICGDDLEVLPTPDFVEFSENHKRSDFVTFKRTNFHPGVLLAVAEEFEYVEMKSALWWKKC